MPENRTTVRDIAGLAVARVGRVKETSDPLLPFRLVDEQGAEIGAVKHDAESKRGRHSQSTEPLRPTKAGVCRSPISA